MYEIRILEAAERTLEQLDRLVARRIARRIRWLAENVDHMSHEALTGDLSGLFKLRVGDYRVVYERLHAEELIVIHIIGHRRDIYRDR